jgi:hypothetical protein
LDTGTAFVFALFRKQISHPWFAMVSAKLGGFFKPKNWYFGTLGVLTGSVANDNHIGFAVLDAKYANFRALLTIRGIH